MNFIPILTHESPWGVLSTQRVQRPLCSPQFVLGRVSSHCLKWHQSHKQQWNSSLTCSPPGVSQGCMSDMCMYIETDIRGQESVTHPSLAVGMYWYSCNGNEVTCLCTWACVSYSMIRPSIIMCMLYALVKLHIQMRMCTLSCTTLLTMVCVC